MKALQFILVSSVIVLAIVIMAGCTGAVSTGSSGPAQGDQPARNTSAGTGGTAGAPEGGMMAGGDAGMPPGATGGRSDMIAGGNVSAPGGDGGPGGVPPGGMGPGGNMSAPSGSMGGPGGMPPGGMGPGGNMSTSASGMGGAGGMPPGGSSGSSSYTLSGAYTLKGGTASETGRTYTSATKDVSAIFVTDRGDLTLTNPTIITSGDSSSNDASSFYGLNAAVLASGGSRITINGGTITSGGSGANGAFPTGTGSTIVLNGVKIKATGGGGHGVMATNGGNLVLTDVDIDTSGANSAPLATDRGSGTVTATRGTITTSGRDSPGIYSTGSITVSDASITATGSEAAVIEGFNSISVTNTTLTGGVGKTGGTMVYQSMSGDADAGTGTFVMNGGTYTVAAGPAFFITNTNALISLTGVKVTSASGTLISAGGTDRWGISGKNGGIVTFTADRETLNGSLVTDSISSIDATLKNGSALTGSINSAALTLDASSTWSVTADSALTTLSDTGGISGTTVVNIHGNGHTVTYDKHLAANTALGGKTYALTGGGTLMPG